MQHSFDPHLTLALEWADDLPYPAETDEITHRVEVLRTRAIRRAKRRLVRKLYQPRYPSMVVLATRSINCRANQRGVVNERVVWSHA